VPTVKKPEKKKSKSKGQKAKVKVKDIDIYTCGILVKLVVMDLF
jgi:hypothetical protein